jgi:hypothetical protein
MEQINKEDKEKILKFDALLTSLSLEKILEDIPQSAWDLYKECMKNT